MLRGKNGDNPHNDHRNPSGSFHLSYGELFVTVTLKNNAGSLNFADFIGNGYLRAKDTNYRLRNLILT